MRNPKLAVRVSSILVTATLAVATPQSAQAQWAVFDAASFAQLMQQVTYWQQQLTQMQNQLGQLKQTYSAMTGSRGMQALLPLAPAARNYLPANWTDVTSLASGVVNGYSGLSNLVAARVQSNAVLTPAALATLNPAQRQLVTDSRNSAASLQGLSQAAYASTSSRFQQLQSLIQAIGGAADEKAISDLQGRIQAEQAMLSNEQAKLTALYQAAQADRWAQEQKTRELSITQLGSVASLHTVTY